MDILHICSYYIGNKLYSRLISNISESDIKQEIYIPIRSESLKGKNEIIEIENINFYYRNILEISDRFFFKKKIRKQAKDLNDLINVKMNINFIHAHTLYSDGCTAYFLYKKYGIKYIVTVRNTDINFFWKYRKDLRKLMYRILENAEKIIFLSPTYEKKLLELIPKSVKLNVEERCLVIPNGIDEFWLEAPKPIVKTSNNLEIKLLFIGQLNKNKNVESIIKACALQNKKGINLTLDIVGEGPLENSLKKLVNELGLKENVNFHGYIDNKYELIKIMDQSHIFVMPSINETFGLVYIEAMSRGLPVIFSKGQAIDGFFEFGKIGYAVNPLEPHEILKSVNLINKDYTRLSKTCVIKSREFDWKLIKNRYIEIYERSCNL